MSDQSSPSNGPHDPNRPDLPFPQPGQQPPNQQPWPQPDQQVPAGAPVAAPTQGSNGLATAGFILGLLGFLSSFIPLLNIIGIILGVIGVVLAAVGFGKVKKVNAGKGLAIARTEPSSHNRADVAGRL